MTKEGVSGQAARIFLNAANYIRTYGWQKDGMGKYGQPRCSMGAIASVYPKEADEQLSEVMYRALYQELDEMTLTKFNQQFNSGEKVAELFEKTAATLQAPH